MGSATARFFTLLSTPFPLLHPRSSSLHLLRLATRRSCLFLSPLPFPRFSPFLNLSLKCSQQLHSQAQPRIFPNDSPPVDSIGSSDTSTVLHPWPELLDFVNWVSFSGYSNGPLDDEFVGSKKLPGDFLRAANGCLAFAQDRGNLLWSLPREDIEVVVWNGSPFLFKNASNATRRMQSFLGGGMNEVLDSDKPSTVDLMMFLLSYASMAIVSSENMHIDNRVESSVRKLFGELAKSRGTSPDPVSSVQNQFPERHRPALRFSGQNIEMKRGDWICPRCSFLNFAKNSKCLQCEEHRPKKFLTGGEWECPQCDFFNFSKNVVCLRCDCKKPVSNPCQSPSTSSFEGNIEKRLAEAEEKHQPWFTKISQLEKSSDMSSSLADEDIPKTLLRGDKKFAMNAQKSSYDGNFGCSDIQLPGVNSNINVEITQTLDEILGQKSSIPYTSNKGVNEKLSNETPSSQKGDNEREQAEKSERWFKKVAELHDVKDLPSAISNENFPETMPIRKEENRFVLSKRKDRSLTSPMYKRRMAIEQAGNNNNIYVPFVPFPPGYFAKDKSPEGSDSKHRDSMSSSAEDAATAMPNNNAKISNNVNRTPKFADSQFTSSSSDRTGSTTGTHFKGASSQSGEKDGWRERRSLEGSAVKEPDPLDMSEEAKAERWFRRAAQIKDISELSQIPDEDFPSIMPMRKGVNRFVVSKRKTPLERRLTSSQYRRNLPVVSSDPVKKEPDSS